MIKVELMRDAASYVMLRIYSQKVTGVPLLVLRDVVRCDTVTVRWDAAMVLCETF